MSMNGSDDDVVQMDGGRFRLPSRISHGSAILAAFTLVLGLGAGYLAGHAGNHAAAPPRPRASASPASSAIPLGNVSPALTQNTMGCSAQVGRNLLELGIPVTNQSTAAITLGGIDVQMPMNGLRIVSRQWGPCGTLPTGQEMFSNTLAPGDTAWLTVTFKVLVNCPGPLPVQFSVGYVTGTQHSSASLPGFPDLSQVPYTGCPSN